MDETAGGIVSYSHYERLSGADLSFLAMEDGRAHMHIGIVTTFDALPLRLENGAIDFERILALFESQLHKVPRLRQKLAYVPGIGQPVWVDDADFNLRFHVRHTALPPPGDIRQLKRMAGRVMSQELDRGKPLWENWFVDCLEGDRFAVVSKVHHCMADGVSGMEIANLLIGPDPEYVADPPSEWVPRPAPRGSQLVVDELRHRAIAPIGMLGSQLRGSGAGSSGSLPSLADLRELAETGVGGASPTPLNVQVGPHRRFDWTRFPFEEVHQLAVSAGGKVNDVVLAVTTAALRHFLHHRGMDVDEIELKAMVPVNVRTDADASLMGNRVSGLIVPLPLSETEPWSCLERIIETTRELKESDQSQTADAMTQMIELLPPRFMGPLFRRGSQSTSANLAVTNVPGPRRPMYMLGSRQLGAYPAVPLIGNQALGIALMSYDDGLYWGFNSDWDAVPDLHDLVESIDVAYEELKAAAPS